MKKTIMAILLATTLFSCSKKGNLTEDQSTKEWYRVLAIGSDTSYTQWMQARTESYSYADSDDYLSAKVIGYSNGQWIVEVKNKQTCGKVDIQFSYESISVTGISPNPKNNIYYNSINSGATQLFFISAKMKAGKIKVKALTVCNWCGDDPKWLKLDVNEGVLPITFLETNTTRDNKTGKVTVSFSIDDPSNIDHFIIERMSGNVSSQAAFIESDKKTKSFIIHL